MWSGLGLNYTFNCGPFAREALKIVQNPNQWQYTGPASLQANCKEMEDQAELLREVFGESSSDGDGEGEESGGVRSQLSFDGGNLRWEQIEGINGLWLCRDFLSSPQQSTLITNIETEGWFTEAPHNQAMRFGDLPEWANELSCSILDAVLYSDYSNEGSGVGVLASHLLWRQPLFDQLIVNVYQAGEGICPHVDLMRFEDGIAIVSLESSCVMHFSEVSSREICVLGERKDRDNAVSKVGVCLTPGSLILMSGEARYLWTHEINRKQGFQIWEGSELVQKKRTSITLRKLCRV